MALDRASLAGLVATVDGFYLRDKKMKKAQADMTAALARDGGVSDADARAYLDALQRYFAPFAREAERALRDVEGRLARVNQQQYNLTAERGVAAKRVEITKGVLTSIAELARR